MRLQLMPHNAAPTMLPICLYWIRGTWRARLLCLQEQLPRFLCVHEPEHSEILSAITSEASTTEQHGICS
jgi:hypothetical protein